jgi:hypothetical protein
MNKVWDSSGLVNGNADVVGDVGHHEVADYTTALRFRVQGDVTQRVLGVTGFGCWKLGIPWLKFC